MGLSLTVGDRVLGKDEEIEECDEVGHDETRPRVLKVVAKTGTYVHPAPRSHKDRERGSTSFSQIKLHSNQQAG